MEKNYTRIIADVSKKIYKGIYFLHGDESYYIDLISDYIAENVLDEAERSFNQLVMYGEETDPIKIIETCRRFPMMANQQVVIVKEAQYLNQIEELSKYVVAPLRSTILVLCYKHKSLAKSNALLKALEKSSEAEIFHSKALRDYQVPDWIDSYFSRNHIKAERRVSAILTEYLGTDLSKIVNELDKLILSHDKPDQMITPEEVERKIGISKDFNNFELQRALAKKEILRANRIINYFGKNQRDNPIEFTLSLIFSFFRRLLIYHYLNDKSRNSAASALKVNPYFVSEYEAASRNYPAGKTVEIISLIREADARLKGADGVSIEPGEILKELVFKIMHNIPKSN